jgi:hypothetical protein
MGRHRGRPSLEIAAGYGDPALPPMQLVHQVRHWYT